MAGAVPPFLFFGIAKYGIWFIFAAKHLIGKFRIWKLN